MKNGKKGDTGSVSHHSAPLTDVGSTGDAQQSLQEGTPPQPTNNGQQHFHPSCTRGFTALAELGGLGKRGPCQQSWWGRGRDRWKSCSPLLCFSIGICLRTNKSLLVHFPFSVQPFMLRLKRRKQGGSNFSHLSLTENLKASENSR